MLLVGTIRDINLSYNQLSFDHPDPKLVQASINFVQNMKKLIIDSALLNHLNFSGM